MLVCSSVAADALPEHVQVGVIMPKLKKPYKIVFDDISNGLFDVSGQSPTQLHINANTEREDIDIWINSSGVNYLVALGEASRNLFKILPPR